MKHLDPDSQALLKALRSVKRHGWGKLEIIIRAGKIEVVHATKTSTRRGLGLDSP